MPVPYQTALSRRPYTLPSQSSSSVEVATSHRPPTSIAVPIDTSSSYIAGIGIVQKASSSTEASVARVQTDTNPLAKLSPLERLRELARTEPVNFASTLVAIPGSAYLLIRSLVAIFPQIGVFFSWNAKAQTTTSDQSSLAALIAASGHNSFDWYVAFLMGVTLVAALGATLFAQNAKKIDFGKDMTKVIVGFAVGFLSGGKMR